MRTLNLPLLSSAFLTLLPVGAALGNATQDACLLNAIKTADSETPASIIRAQCATPVIAEEDEDLIEDKLVGEKLATANRWALLPHHRNYLLPVTYNPDPQTVELPPDLTNFYPEENPDNIEVKFQLSLKFIFAEDTFLEDDTLNFAFTTQSYWQAYNADVSAPFRETNYEPEIFWVAPIRDFPLNLVDAHTVAVGLSHQSNGRSGTFSRSWNRVYADFAWEKGNFVFNLKPWYRLPEDEKESPLDPKGDDNPDIDDYMGNFEFTTVYRRQNHEFSIMARNSFQDSRGAIQVEWTFPFWKGLKGYAQYFNGYGESLIDYDTRVERIGVGILLNDLY